MNTESKVVLGYGHKWPEGEGLVRENFPIWAVMRGRGILWRVRSRIEKEFAPSSWACDLEVWSAPDFQSALEIIQDCYQRCPDTLLAPRNQEQEVASRQAAPPTSVLNDAASDETTGPYISPSRILTSSSRFKRESKLNSVWGSILIMSWIPLSLLGIFIEREFGDRAFAVYCVLAVTLGVDLTLRIRKNERIRAASLKAPKT
jgi:hypothetical protein